MTKHGRLIDAEWLKVAIHNFFTGLNHQVTEDDIMAYIDAAPTIETKLSAQPEQRWIPVSTLNDIPPDHEVICCDKEEELIIGYMWCDCGQWICESPEAVMYDPVAYMEKPEPYKEEQDDDK